MKTSKDYLKIVEWSSEDECYVGLCPGLIRGGVHGDDEREVYNELCVAVEEVLELYLKDGEKLPDATAKNYSGKFVLRTGSELHRHLSLRAANESMSLNQYSVRILSGIGFYQPVTKPTGKKAAKKRKTLKQSTNS